MSNRICPCTELEKFYFSPVIQLPGYANGDYLNLYAFVAKNDYTGSGMFATKQVYKGLLYLKKINVNDISPVAERINWTANTFYHVYTDTSGLGETLETGKLKRKFYIKNKYDQVFKCLSNNTNEYDSYDITNITNHDTHCSIEHEGPTYDIGDYITLLNINSSVDNSYLVVGSSLGVANVAISNTTPYCLSTPITFANTGIIKSAIVSTEEPIFNTGSFDEEIVVKTADGYKWKYLYTINKGSKFKFYDDDWMPVPVQVEYPNPYLSDSKYGSVDIINVVNGGTGYTNGSNTVNITILGDGEGAVAEAFVANTIIQDITVTNKGYNYTYANVTITPIVGSGSGAKTSLSISPIGGHGFNLVRELYCKNVMVSAVIDKDESGRLPTDITFNQVGILQNPYLTTDTENHANASFITCMTEVLISTQTISNYISGETVYQGNSLAESSFNAKVVSFDETTYSLKLSHVYGTPQENYELQGQTSGSRGVINSIITPLYVPYSGILYFLSDNTDNIVRDPEGSEQIRLLVNYNT